MNLSYHIAKRYLFSKKKTNIINVISAISGTGVCVGTIALVVTLSIFNGLEDMVNSMFNIFDPDLKVEIVQGKTFEPNTDSLQRVKQLEGIASYDEVLQDQALLNYGDHQRIAIVKGIDTSSVLLKSIEKSVLEGNLDLRKDEHDFTIMGNGVARDLNVGLHFINPIRFYYPRKGKSSALSLTTAFVKTHAYPSALFSIQQDIDVNYVLVNRPQAEKLFQSKGKISAIEINVANIEKIDKLKKEIRTILGPNYTVKDRLEQHPSIFKAMRSERWAIFTILSFILIIASFNIVGSLTMIILDKQQDIAILRSMGANQKLIRNIFLFEGWSISVLGASIGMLIGGVVCGLQQAFGFVKLQGASLAIDAYPVKVVATDLIIIYATVLLIGFCASYFPVRFIKLKGLKSKDANQLV